MARKIRLRPWQKRALDRLAACDSPDFLAVATPGAGKTTFALCAAVQDLAENPGRRLVVVTPTSHLKVQWADAGARFGLHLEPRWSPSGGRLPADVHGIVTTYQQVASNPDALRPIAARSMVVLDEIHHAGDERAWGEAVRRAFEVAPRRLALSGTPFRSDTLAIPFVRYVGDEAVPDFEYGYADALADGRVVRPVYFPRINGFMEWIAPDGTAQSAAFDDPLDRARAAQRLRTALSLDGEWLPTVLVQADERLRALRRSHPEAGGLVIAADQDHAQGIAELLRVRCGVRATVAVSDDPMSSSRIARFATSTDPWIVAVRMVSEGVDIPRLRVGVYATTTTTELFFRQAVGRLVRWTRGVPRQKAYLFIPDDVRLRTYATQIADARRHTLRRHERDGDEPAADEAALDELRHEDDRGEQLSMFTALSAVVTGEDTSSVFEADDATLDRLDRLDAAEDGGEGDAALELDLPPLPGSTRHVGAGGNGDGRDPRREREELRERNAKLVQDIVWATGLAHAQVNGRLNRLVGVRRVDEATVEQLRRRAQQAERWLASV
ncbi:MAG TPA: DEAD/DEAH box helicase [Acidimicrobiales bacterium]|jgi:superfamily II DNA or RNA helicase|nr:DEAD/DEAH box helicase [Acidimicrobiales bacterium]